MLVFTVAILLPLASFAATYFYVDSQGVVKEVNAQDASTALNIAPNIASNSGVASDRGDLEAGDRVSLAVLPVETHTYFYVNTQGMVSTVEAQSATDALENAPSRASNSGVAIDDGDMERGAKVLAVATN